MKYLLKSSKGFTLAEVLLIITIIGIIAAETIPPLVKDTQYKYLRAAWKQNYSIAAQVTIQLSEENNGTIVGLWTSNNGIRSNYQKYLKEFDACSWNNPENPSHPFKLLNGQGDNFKSYAQFKLYNGSWWRFNVPLGGCSGNCGNIDIDVNGAAQPNIAGRDVFRLWVQRNGKITPDATYCIEPPAKNWNADWNKGWGCSKIVLLE